MGKNVSSKKRTCVFIVKNFHEYIETLAVSEKENLSNLNEMCINILIKLTIFNPCILYFIFFTIPKWKDIINFTKLLIVENDKYIPALIGDFNMRYMYYLNSKMTLLNVTAFNYIVVSENRSDQHTNSTSWDCVRVTASPSWLN